MRTARLLVWPLILATVVFAGSTWAALVESVESGRAIAARAKIAGFLGEQQVAHQLTALGLSPEQARARVARLSDAQVEELAGQVDLLRAGGTIQGGNPNPIGPLQCVFAPLGRFFYNLYELIFCWGSLK